MNSSKGSQVQQMIEEGLKIFHAEGTARAWVFMTSNAVPPSIVAEVLAAAAKLHAASALGRSASSVRDGGEAG
ncbi:hypothetical protein [Duganella levis]|uniref:Uncharacterized protein n=1 Tax=Duganella levis TaxID=2692169 RepID=A0ABW9VT96_9BURK|nr:hypothetical protein [Duganella levis]MYN24842.1 hypothetical protein [Duganella levis]